MVDLEINLKKKKKERKEKQFSILHGKKNQEENVLVESYSGHLFPMT